MGIGLLEAGEQQQVVDDAFHIACLPVDYLGEALVLLIRLCLQQGFGETGYRGDGCFQFMGDIRHKILAYLLQPCQFSHILD